MVQPPAVADVLQPAVTSYRMASDLSDMKKPETAVNALAEEFPKVALIKHTRQRAWIQLISRMNHHGKWKIQLMPIVAYPNQQQIRVIPL